MMLSSLDIVNDLMRRSEVVMAGLGFFGIHACRRAVISIPEDSFCFRQREVTVYMDTKDNKIDVLMCTVSSESVNDLVCDFNF